MIIMPAKKPQPPGGKKIRTAVERLLLKDNLRDQKVASRIASKARVSTALVHLVRQEMLGLSSQARVRKKPGLKAKSMLAPGPATELGSKNAAIRKAVYHNAHAKSIEAIAMDANASANYAKAVRARMISEGIIPPQKRTLLPGVQASALESTEAKVRKALYYRGKERGYKKKYAEELSTSPGHVERIAKRMQDEGIIPPERAKPAAKRTAQQVMAANHGITPEQLAEIMGYKRLKDAKRILEMHNARTKVNKNSNASDGSIDAQVERTLDALGIRDRGQRMKMYDKLVAERAPSMLSALERQAHSLMTRYQSVAESSSRNGSHSSAENSKRKADILQGALLGIRQKSPEQAILMLEKALAEVNKKS